jgi:hypothetical protein
MSERIIVSMAELVGSTKQGPLMAAMLAEDAGRPCRPHGSVTSGASHILASRPSVPAGSGSGEVRPAEL